MIQRKIISFFLLCLLFLINGHNTFFHAHHEPAKEAFAVVHKHDHHHSGHHHGPHKMALRDWIKQILGGFEHPDLGENHFELFLNPSNQLGLGQASALTSPPFIFTSVYLHFLDVELCQNNNRPSTVLSFSDPPFFGSLSNRGPPAFS